MPLFCDKDDISMDVSHLWLHSLRQLLSAAAQKKQRTDHRLHPHSNLYVPNFFV